MEDRAFSSARATSLTPFMRIKMVFFLAGLLYANFAVAADPAPQDGEPMPDVAAVSVKPKLLKPEQPVYPYNQARAGVNGTVTVEFIIDPQGRVRNPYVVGSNNPAFERPAIDAVLKWKFSPGKMDGRPVNVRAVQKIEFLMDSGGANSGFWQITKAKDHSSLPPELRWDKAPVPESTTFPVYPFAALQGGVKGKTLISFVVGPNGMVVKSKILQATTPEMGQAALAMIDTWHFTPAKKKDGTPLFAALGLEHNFAPSGMGDVPVTYAAQRILRLLEKHPEKIIGADKLDRLPRAISKRPPIYPLALNESKVTGQVVVEFFIDEEGDAQLPHVISSSAPEFGYAAMQALAAWRFEPAKKNDKAVIVRVRIPMEFNQKPEQVTSHH
jgi:TonB family protein